MVKLSASRSFKRSLAASRDARAFLEATLTRWGRPQSHAEAQLIAAELVTNVVRHVANGDVAVSLDLDDDQLRISVTDEVPRLVPSVNAPHGDGGYGLNIVTALAQTWGWVPSTDAKTVWAELDIGPSA